ELSYQELRRLAHVVRGGGGGDTVNTTALVHEAYLKLMPGDNLIARDRAHFFRIAARAMRQVLVDLARRRSTRNRGLQLMVADASLPDAHAVATTILALDAALHELEGVSPRQA